MDFTLAAVIQTLKLLVILGLLSAKALAQTCVVSGFVGDSSGKAIPNAQLQIKELQLTARSNAAGAYDFTEVPKGQYTLVCFSAGKAPQEVNIQPKAENLTVNFSLKNRVEELKAYEVRDKQNEAFGVSRLNAVHDFGIYEGKKSELVTLNETGANLATNNPRQVFSKVTGLNIWESDGAGLQLGIGGRGLSPNRTASFNVRQNGYDISADALGYPESYYTPPAEALESIEIVRGAASLQYGTQFGGLLNFRFKNGSYSKKAELISRQTVGSWGFFNSFNSLGGTTGRLNYYSFVQYKRGNGYRENSGFEQFTGYFSGVFDITDTWQMRAEFTRMNYLARQAGGLTDKNFEEDSRQSFRNRNWFQVDWNLASIQLTHRFNSRTELNIKNFGLIATRKTVGNLERINVADLGGNRTVIDGQFQNLGSETRLLHRYSLGKQMQVFLGGLRIYSGETTANQGFGTDGSDANFNMLAGEPDQSSYTFPNLNVALFAEHIFRIGKRFSITPGLRYEYISTSSSGYYKSYVYDFAGNLITESRSDEESQRIRRFIIGGIGLAYNLKEAELYGNFSQNYRAINFSDLRVVNPNFVVDPDIIDEKGFTADLGIRGLVGKRMRYELTGFFISYDDKIGQILTTAGAPLYNNIRFRTNVSDAENFGIESFLEWNVLEADSAGKRPKLSVFVNTAYVNARYVRTNDSSIRGKKVEMVPPVIFRCGTELNYKGFGINMSYAYTAAHFSDATNAVLTATAVEGSIPAYHVADLSLSYSFKRYMLQLSCNNALNEQYFTRRAESYPGPGIIPADGRAFFLSLQIKI